MWTLLAKFFFVYNVDSKQIFVWLAIWIFLYNRGRKALESLSLAGDERIDTLEQQLKEAKYISEDADRKYDEVKLKMMHELGVTFLLHVKQ